MFDKAEKVILQLDKIHLELEELKQNHVRLRKYKKMIELTSKQDTLYKKLRNMALSMGEEKWNALFLGTKYHTFGEFTYKAIVNW